MPFTVNDYQDLLRLLEEHPEWREELRRALLSDDFLALPRLVQELIQAQQRTEEALQRLAETTEERLDALAEAQRRTDERLEALAEAQQRTEERLEALAEAQQRTEVELQRLAEAQRRTDERVDELAQRLEQLTQRVDQLTQRVDQLTQRVDDLTVRLDQLTQRVDDLTVRLEQLTRRVDELTVRVDQLTQRVDELTQRVDELTEMMTAIVGEMRDMKNRLATLTGWMYEQRYRVKPAGYFGKLLRRARLVTDDELYDLVEDHSEIEEVEDLLQADLIVRGRLRANGKRPEVWLVVEVSGVADRNDVERAVRRAQLLRQLGYLAIPAAGGERWTAGAELAAKEARAALISDGRPPLFWDEAVQAWTAQED